MNEKTYEAIKAILATDPSVTQEQVKAVFKELSDKPKDIEVGDRVLSRKEVAAIFGKTVKAVDIYGKRGVIRRVYLSGGGNGRAKAQGYSMKSVLEVMQRGKPTCNGGL